MANFVNYSPWQDAANYGQGLGQALGQILLQQPRQRAEFQMQQERFPLEQQLLQAQVKNTEFQPEYRNELLGLRQQSEQDRNTNAQQGLDIKSALLALQQQIQPQRVDIAQQNADSNTQNAGSRALQVAKPRVSGSQPHAPSSATMNGQNELVAKLLPLLGQSEFGGQANTNMPVNVMTAGQQALQSNPGVNPLEVLKQFVQPNVQTNQPGMIGKMLGRQPQVVTNGASFGVPEALQALQSHTQGQQTNAPTPVQTAVNPTTGQRLQLINGQWQPIQ